VNKTTHVTTYIAGVFEDPEFIIWFGTPMAMTGFHPLLPLLESKASQSSVYESFTSAALKALPD